MEIKRGQVVRSHAGHDKGDFQTVLSTDGIYVVLCDGKRRSLEKPKRKKQIHVAPTGVILSEEVLKTNRLIKNALKPFQQKG